MWVEQVPGAVHPGALECGTSGHIGATTAALAGVTVGIAVGTWEGVG